MEINWIIKQGSYGLSVSLLLLYRKAVFAGVAGEKERWQFAFQNPSLPIPLTREDLVAFKQILEENKFWDGTDSKYKTPARIVGLIVMRKSNNAVGGILDSDNAEIIVQGIVKGLKVFCKKYPEIEVDEESLLLR